MAVPRLPQPPLLQRQKTREGQVRESRMATANGGFPPECGWMNGEESASPVSKTSASLAWFDNELLRLRCPVVMVRYR